MAPSNLPSLLLLPPPPQPANKAALNAAYRPALRGAIEKLRNEQQRGATLLVAVGLPVLQGPYRRQKALSWPESQSLLAGLYSIIAIISAELGVGTDVNGGPGTVDTRIVLVDRDGAKGTPPDFKPSIELNNTVILDVGTFASAYHPWNYIFHVSSEPGLEFFKSYLRMFEGLQVLRQDQLIPVPGGIALMEKSVLDKPAPAPTPLYPVVCLGGTFDHLHLGHKLLLTAMVLLLEVPVDQSNKHCTCIIGITGDEMLKKKKYADQMQSWDERATNILAFLASILNASLDGWKGGQEPAITKKDGEYTAYFRDNTILIKCEVIQDAYGPTITVKDMDALVVSGETRSGGAAVNDRREEKGFPRLEVFEVDVLDAKDVTDQPAGTEDFGSKISSTEIRRLKAEATSRM